MKLNHTLVSKTRVGFAPTVLQREMLYARRISGQLRVGDLFGAAVGAPESDEEELDEDDLMLTSSLGGGGGGDSEQLLQLRAQQAEDAKAAFTLQTTKSWHEARYWLVRVSKLLVLR